MKTTSIEILEIMFEGDNSAESKKFERELKAFFKMRKSQGDKIQIISHHYGDITQLSGVYEVNEIERLHSLSAFVDHVADMIGFEIAERYQRSDSATLVNESGFKLTATLEEV